jgi:hypothetical protein
MGWIRMPCSIDFNCSLRVGVGEFGMGVGWVVSQEPLFQKCALKLSQKVLVLHLVVLRKLPQTSS